MHSKKIIAILFLLFSLLVNSQEERFVYTTFAKIPTKVDASLYINLKNAKALDAKLAYLDTIAQIFNKVDLPDSLLVYGKKIQNEIQKHSLKNNQYSIYNARGIYYEAIAKREMGILDEAIAAFIKGIELTSNEEKTTQSYLYLGLAETYLIQERLEKANVILNNIYTPTENTDLKLNILATKGDYFYLKGEWKQAELIYKEVLRNPIIKKIPKLMLRLNLSLGRLEARKGNLQKALVAFEKVKEESLTHSFYDLYIKSILNIGQLYRQQKKYNLAEVILSTAYANSISWNRLKLQKDVNRALVALYAAKEDYENAYGLMTQYESVSALIAAKQNKRQVRELEQKYESLKKEREITELQKEQLIKENEIDRQKTIKNVILIAFLIFLVPIILLLVVYYQKLQAQSRLNKQQEILNRQEMQSLHQEQELKLAKTAISAQQEERSRIARELHDSIGGNLAAIKLQFNNSPLQDELSAKLLKQLDSTYQQVREISHNMIPQQFKEQSFINLINDYLQQLNNGKKTALSFNAYPEQEINQLSQELQVTLFNMIKELATNAIKHARADQVELQLSFISEEKSISLLYEDDGIGFNPHKKSRGIGLKNLQKRVDDLKATFSINSSPQNGTVISINIPYS